MKRQILSAILFAFFTSDIYAQDFYFSNINASPALLNPSFAGSNGLLRINTSYQRDFMPYADFSHAAASIDGFVKSVNGGVSLSFNNEGIQNITRKSMLNIAYAQYLNFPGKNIVVIPSIQAGISERRFNPNVIVWNPTLPQPETQTRYLNLNAGLVAIYRTNFCAGIVLRNLNRPAIGTFDSRPAPIQVTLHSSYSFHLSKKSLLQLTLRFDDNVAVSRAQISANAILFSHLIVGTGYSTQDVLHVSCGGRTNNFALQFVYNLRLSKLLENSSKCYEVHLSYNLRKKEIRGEVPLFERM